MRDYRPQSWLPHWPETGWTPAQRMAQSMLWPERQPAGRVTEAGLIGWAWSLAPKVATWLGGLGIYIAVSEVATDLASTSPSQQWAEEPASASNVEYWRQRVIQWWNYAEGSSAKGQVLDPARVAFLQPVYARSLQLIDEPGVTKGQIGALYGTWARYVQKQVKAYPGPAPVNGDEVITGSIGTIYIDPVTGASLSPGKPSLGLAGWFAVLSGAYSLWRQFRG